MSLDEIWLAERPSLVARLARKFGDLGLAEDAVQEAFASAAVRWPVDGLPDRPGAWLSTASYRKAIGMLRKQRPDVNIDETLLAGPHDINADLEGSVAGPELDRDLFGLMLTCCHPSLASDARIALTLRHVCGLGVSEIASVLLVAEPTMAKRLVRARRKIKDAAISFEPPRSSEALAERLDDVRTVVYVVFTEGHLSSSVQDTVRGDLCEEAIWLARQLDRVRPDDPDTIGLLALMCIQHARRDARLDHQGTPVLFADQDRTKWDHDAIDEARQLLARPIFALGRYQVEAAIALLHVSGDAPDWSRIADLYGVLGRLNPSPIVEVNRGFAVGKADGPRLGLGILDKLIAQPWVAKYALLHAARGQLLEDAGEYGDAADAWRSALALTNNEAQRAELQQRLAEH